MNDFAIKNYASKKNGNKATIRGFLITLMFIAGGLSIVIADHVGHTLQQERAVDVAAR
jgi:hypothetical protein